MFRNDSAELEQSYFLPPSAVSSSVVLRNSLLASNWTGESKVSLRKRVEVVHDSVGSGHSFSHTSSLCQPCATETMRILSLRAAELADDIRKYDSARETFSCRQNLGRETLDQVQQEIFSLTKELSMFDEIGLMNYVQCTSLRNEIAQNKLLNNSAVSEALKLDIDISALDTEILNTLELLDCTAREINYLKGHPSDNYSVSVNKVAPLFDSIECSSDTEVDSCGTINRCRLSYAANSRLNLNYSEINKAYVNLSVHLTCLRNACDLPSINLIGVAAGSNSPYYSPAYRVLLQQQLAEKVSKGGTLSLCGSRLSRLLNLLQGSDTKGPINQGLILQLRSLQSKVLLRLLSPTGPTSATEDWLHLEAGVMTSFVHQTYSFKTSSRRNHRKVDWQGSGSCGGGSSAGSGSAAAAGVGGGSGEGSATSRSSGPISANPPASVPPPVNFFNNLLANSILFQSPASTPSPKAKAATSSGMAPTSPYPAVVEEDQEAVVVESDQDDPVYRRAVIGLAMAAAVTAIDVLLARQKLTHAQLLTMSVVDSFRILWSLVSIHLKGCMMEVACALMTGVPVGFEESLEPVNETMPASEEFEVIEGLGADGYSTATAGGVMEHSVVNKVEIVERSKVCRQESLFDLKRTRVSEMHQLVMDLMTTLKHICSLE